jgi:hypothetical protein
LKNCRKWPKYPKTPHEVCGIFGISGDFTHFRRFRPIETGLKQAASGPIRVEPVKSTPEGGARPENAR